MTSIESEESERKWDPCLHCGYADAMECYIHHSGERYLNPESLRDRVSEKIKQWRSANGWPLKALGIRIGVAPSTISLWERGKRFPNIENLIALGIVMGIPPCRFFCPMAEKAKDATAPD